MRKLITLVMLCALATTMFAQQAPTTEFSKSDYLKKSRNQKKAAWILLGSGAAMTITGAAIPAELVDVGNPFDPRDDKYSNNWGALVLPGTLAMLASVPFFIASGKNKRKANRMALSLKPETISYVRNTSVRKFQFPAIAVKVNL